uniref:Homeobox domain-containing protein n=3 Tax=Aegilops tauschii subsp. strangulata TaxID=200361 RepID=A0A453F4A2_AEGTS
VMGATSPSGLELTMAVPGLSSSSGSEGFVCNNIINNNGGGSMRDLDMNQPASGGEEEDFLMGGLEEDEEERGAGGPHRPKKLRLSKEQSRLLEESFRLNHTLSPKQKEALAIKLKLRPRQVEVWFQNRRARTKLKHTEMECEYLKRCFGSLTEENRRLQREVEELRAMRMAPPTVLSPHTRQPLPASALTMCPRCERVTAATGPRITRPAASPFHPRRPSAAF